MSATARREEQAPAKDAGTIRAVDLAKSYPVSDTERLHVLQGLSLEVGAGQTVGIIGPSGCGKSTLLNILGTLDEPDSGDVVLEGRNVADLDAAALAHLRNRRLGFVFQLHHLLPQCTVLENVLVPTLVGGGADTAAPRARHLLERVGLADRLQHYPGQLSGGERQRVAVVRALVNRPAVLLADEPTGSLDRAGAAALCDLLVELNAEEKVAIVMVTHAVELAERMQRVFELRDGALSAAQSK